MRGRRILLASAVSVGTVLAATVGIAGPAFASIDNNYSGVAAQEVQGAVVPRDTPQVLPVQAVQAENPTLPVTGGDIAELAGMGLILVGSGTVLVRRGRRRA
jgi:hypothetical protein